MMRFTTAVAGLVLVVAPLTLAKDPPSYDKGTLLSMQSTKCGTAEKEGKSLSGEILGTDSGHKNIEEVLCQEYVMQTDRMTYRIRPKDDKHPVLLPVGEAVQFRIQKDKLYLRVPEGDQKERQYTVLSVEMRQDLKDQRALASKQ
ncbi:MAG TPA: hypothetical protein VN881_10455 [Candidatus Acidoferrales bacterium]|jgi:hypothetical protein|nr:hypothetical protein [Candidatus Acidoferrales bacterium]